MIATDELFKKYCEAYRISDINARFVLPNATETEIVVTANMREWRHIFSLRCDVHAQWEIRKATIECLKVLSEKCPNVFFDIVEEVIIGGQK